MQGPIQHTLTVVSYNVHSGKKVKDLAELFQTHERLKQADIILFQEIEHHEKELASRAERVAEALGFSFVYAPAWKMNARATHGLAIASRFPIKTFEVVPLVYFRQRTRIALLATMDVLGEEVLVCNVHLDVRLNLHERIEQIKPALAAIERIGVPRVIVGGDLNTAPVVWFARFLPVFYREQRRAVERFLQSNDYESSITGVSYTLKRWVAKLHLDSMFVRGFSAVGAGMEAAVALSDHQPVWTELAVAQSRG